MYHAGCEEAYGNAPLRESDKTHIDDWIIIIIIIIQHWSQKSWDTV